MSKIPATRDETIASKVKDILADILRLDRDAIDSQDAAASLSDWDSLKHLSIIMAIEEEFLIAIPPEQIPQLTSYTNIINWLGAQNL